MSKKINMSIDPMTIQEGFDAFYVEKKANNNSENTLYYYESIMRRLSYFHPLDSPIESITDDVVKHYMIYLKESGISDRTVQTYIKGLRAVVYYFMKRGWLAHYQVSLPQATKKLKEIYTDDELRLLLKKPSVKKCGFEEYRNWVIVNYLVGTGQRRRSVINIKIEDIDLDNGIVKLTATKNNKETFLPLSGVLVNILKEYLRYRGGEAGDYLFCTDTGGKFTKDGFYIAIRRYNLSRGVQKTSVHLFRHTFATKWVRQNGDIVKLQHLLCHADLKTTQVYLDMTLDDLKDGFDEMNPLESLVRPTERIKLK